MSLQRWTRRAGRTCCSVATYVPLVFVYGLTTWSVWVMVKVGNSSIRSSWIGNGSSLIAILLYLLLNWSYTVAVFTPPGSTTNDDGYGLLPTHGAPPATSFTVKSNGEIRFCKKCQARKPDRAHHCSTCRRCVLKMDHHCPWLATCVGLRNYKAFLLFLLYVTVFCLYGFAVSGCWIWAEILDQDLVEFETLLPINFVMMCVMGGIIGLVVGIFTAWHVMLACRGQTTIECLEKTRYLSPLRKPFNQAHNPSNSVPPAAQHFVDFHTNALPGITRPEEGEERRTSDMPRSNGSTRPVQMSYAQIERERSQKRYEEYLDEQDSGKLPNAFDLGWKRNLQHLFGPKPLLWALPICNTTGDGWAWEANPFWIEGRDRLRSERMAQREREISAGWGSPGDEPVHIVTTNASNSGSLLAPSSSRGPSPGMARQAPSKADRVLGRDPDLYADGKQDVPLRRLSQRGRTVEDDLDDLEDEDYYDDDGGAGMAANGYLSSSRAYDEEAQIGNGTAAAAAAGASGTTMTNNRRDAERRALDVVTNGRGGAARWGGASGMLRKGSSHSVKSGRSAGSLSRAQQQQQYEDDEGVD